MPSHESTLGPAPLRFADEAEVDRFVAMLDKFERGEVTPEEWRSFRLVHGTYGQRQDENLHMLRVKIPQGALSAEQARVLAEVAERWSRGFGHFTTRQNMQLHFVPLADVPHAMRRLAEAGLTTREACGNSVRNITCAPSAGVAADEPFDPTPYARALTRYLLRHPLTSTLPRKFKIAFAGGPSEHAYASVNDIGFWPVVVEGKRCFRITVAGGTSTVPRAGVLLEEHLPAGEIFAVCEAILRVFFEHGDRVHKLRNRMKFLVKQLGWETFERRVREELSRIRADGVPPLPFDPEAPGELEHPPAVRTQPPTLDELRALVAQARWDEPRPPTPPPVRLPLADAEARWRRSNVRSQRQSGHSIATVTLSLGDVSGAHLRALAWLAESYGDGTLRTTQGQDITLRWIRDQDVSALYAALAVIDLHRADIDTLADVTSCPGAESCKLAVTRSRGAAAQVNEHFATRLGMLDRVGPLEVRVSGCPNGCGLHHVAGIGLQGGLRKVDGRSAPQYFVYLGGDARVGRFGKLSAKVPARRVGATLERLATLYLEEREDGEAAADFFARASPIRVKAVLADLEPLTTATASEEDFVDLGDQIAFRGETSEGECAS